MGKNCKNKHFDPQRRQGNAVQPQFTQQDIGVVHISVNALIHQWTFWFFFGVAWYKKITVKPTLRAQSTKDLSFRPRRRAQQRQHTQYNGDDVGRTMSGLQHYVIVGNKKTKRSQIKP